MEVARGGRAPNSDGIKWIEKTFPIDATLSCDIWDEMFNAVRLGKPFTVTLDESVEVMRIVSMAKAQSNMYRSGV